MVPTCLAAAHRATRRSERDATGERQRVQRYVDSLPGRFFDETSIDAAAQQLEIARRTFTKLFAEIAGATWLQHLRRLAIEHARRRLRGSDVAIASKMFYLFHKNICNCVVIVSGDTDLVPAIQTAKSMEYGGRPKEIVVLFPFMRYNTELMSAADGHINATRKSYILRQLPNPVIAGTDTEIWKPSTW